MTNMDRMANGETFFDMGDLPDPAGYAIGDVYMIDAAEGERRGVARFERAEGGWLLLGCVYIGPETVVPVVFRPNTPPHYC